MWKQNPSFVFLLHKHGILYLDEQIHAYYKLVSSWITGFSSRFGSDISALLYIAGDVSLSASSHKIGSPNPWSSQEPSFHWLA